MVLATLLLAGGLGSLVSQRWAAEQLAGRMRFVGVGIAALVLLYWLALPPLVDALLGASFAVRLLAIVLLTAMLGFLMGMPFPALLRMAGQAKQQIALLWAINGAFSVLGSSLAVVLSMLLGFQWAMLTGAGAYLIVSLVAALLRADRRAPDAARQTFRTGAKGTS